MTPDGKLEGRGEGGGGILNMTRPLFLFLTSKLTDKFLFRAIS